MEEVVVAVSVVAPLLLLVVVLIKCLGCLRKKEGFKTFENDESRMEARINPGFIMGQDIEEPVQPVPSTAIQIEPLPEILSETTPRKPKIACVEKTKQESALKLVVMNNPHPFPRRQLKYLNEIGTGWFGHVLESDAEHITTGIPLSRVVAKVLKDEASNAEKKLFLEDVIPYRELEHSNILRLLGQCTESAPYLMILESAQMGDLKACLRRQKNQGNFQAGKYQLVKFAIDAASGLACLHRHGYIHQDFAARNCLVMADYTVKVGDYGIAEDGYRDDYYNSGKEVLPIRWMSPESLSHQSGAWQTAVITKEANIWSYGVLIWEVLMFGNQPYSNMSDTEVLQSVIADRMIKLPEPDVDIQFKDRIVEVMQFCWLNPGQRPSIEEAHGLLQRLANRVTGGQEKEENFEKKWNQLIPSEARVVSAKPEPKQQKRPLSASFDSDFASAPKSEPVIVDQVLSPTSDELMSVKVESGLSTSIVNMPPGMEQDLGQLPTPSQPKLPALMTSTPVIDPAFAKPDMDTGEKQKKSNASSSRTSRKIEEDFEKVSTATVESSSGSRSLVSPSSVEEKKSPDISITIPPKESSIDLLQDFDKSKPEPLVSPDTAVDMLGDLKTESPPMEDTSVDLFKNVQEPTLKETVCVPEGKKEEASTDGKDVDVDLISDNTVDLLSKGTGDLFSVDGGRDHGSKDIEVDLLNKNAGGDLLSNSTSEDLLSKDTNVDLLDGGDTSAQVQDVPFPTSAQTDPFASLLPSNDIQSVPLTDSTAKCDMQSAVSGLDELDKPSEVGKQTSPESSAESDANLNKLSLVHSSDVELVLPSNYEKQSAVDMNSDNLIQTTFQPIESLPSEVEMKQGVDDPISKSGEEKQPDIVVENGVSGYETHSVVDQSKSESHDDSTTSGPESSSDSAVCVSSPELADAPSSFDGAAPSSDKNVSQRPSEGASVSPLNEADAASQILAGEFKMSDTSLPEGSTAVSSGAGQGDKAIQGSGQGQDSGDNETVSKDLNSAFEKLASQHDIGLDMFGLVEESNASNEQYDDFTFGSISKSNDIDLFGDFPDTENTQALDKPDVSVSAFFTGVDVAEIKGNMKGVTSASKSDHDVGATIETETPGDILDYKSEELTKVNNAKNIPVDGDKCNNVEDSKSPDDILQNVNETESDFVNSKLDSTNIDSSVSQSFIEVKSPIVSVGENVSDLVTEEGKKERTQSLLDLDNSMLESYEVLSHDRDSVTEESKETVMVPSVDSTFAFSASTTHDVLSDTSKCLGEDKMDLDTDKTSEDRSESFVVLREDMIKDSIQTNLKVCDAVESVAETEPKPSNLQTVVPEDLTQSSDSNNFKDLNENSVSKSEANEALNMFDQVQEPKEIVDVLDEVLEPKHRHFVDTDFDISGKAVDGSESNDIKADDVDKKDAVTVPVSQALDVDHSSVHTDLLSVTSAESDVISDDLPTSSPLATNQVGSIQDEQREEQKSDDFGSIAETGLGLLTLQKHVPEDLNQMSNTPDFIPVDGDTVSLSETNKALDMLDQVFESREIVDVLDEVLEPGHHDSVYTDFDISDKAVDSSVNDDSKESLVEKNEPASNTENKSDQGPDLTDTDHIDFPGEVPSSVTEPEKGTEGQTAAAVLDENVPERELVKPTELVHEVTVPGSVADIETGNEATHLKQTVNSMNISKQESTILTDNMEKSPLSFNQNTATFEPNNIANPDEDVLEQHSGDSSDVLAWEPIKRADLLDGNSQTGDESSKGELSKETLDSLDHGENAFQVNLEESHKFESKEGIQAEVETLNTGDLISEQTYGSSSDAENIPEWKPIQSADLMDEVTPASGVMNENISPEEQQSVSTIEGPDIISPDEESSPVAKEEPKIVGGVSEVQDTLAPDLTSGLSCQPPVDSSHQGPAAVTDLLSERSVPSDSRNDDTSEPVVDILDSYDKATPPLSDNIVSSVFGLDIETQDTTVAHAESSNAVDSEIKSVDSEIVPELEPIQTTDIENDTLSFDSVDDSKTGIDKANTQSFVGNANISDPLNTISTDEESSVSVNEEGTFKEFVVETQDSSVVDFSQSEPSSDGMEVWEPIKTADMLDAKNDSIPDDHVIGSTVSGDKEPYELSDNFDEEHLISNDEKSFFAVDERMTAITSDTKSKSMSDSSNTSSSHSSSDSCNADVSEWEPIKSSDLQDEVPVLDSIVTDSEKGKSARSFEQSVDMLCSFDTENSKFQEDPFAENKPDVVIDEGRNVKSESLMDMNSNVTGQDSPDVGLVSDREPLKTSDFVNEVHYVSPEKDTEVGIGATNSEQSVNTSGNSGQEDTTSNAEFQRESLSLNKENIHDVSSGVTQDLSISESRDDPFEQLPADSSQPWEPMKTTDSGGNNAANKKSNTEVLENFDYSNNDSNKTVSALEQMCSVDEPSVLDEALSGQPSAEITNTEDFSITGNSFQDSFLTSSGQSVSAEGTSHINYTNGFDFIEAKTDESTKQSEAVPEQYQPESGPVALDVFSSPDELTVVSKRDDETPIDHDRKDFTLDLEKSENKDNTVPSDSINMSDPSGISDPFESMRSTDQTSPNPFVSGTSDQRPSRESDLSLATLSSFDDLQTSDENVGSSDMPKQPSFDAQAANDNSSSNPFSDASEFSSVSVCDCAQPTSSDSIQAPETGQQLNSLDAFASESQGSPSDVAESNMYADAPSDTISAFSNQNTVINPFLDSEEVVKSERTVSQESLSSLSDSVVAHDKEMLSDFVDLGMRGDHVDIKRNQKPTDSSQLTDSLLEDFVKVSTDIEVAKDGSESGADLFASPRNGSGVIEKQPESASVETYTGEGDVSKSVESSEEPASDFMFLGNDQVEKSQSNGSFSDISDGFKESSNLGQSIIDFPDSSMTDSQESPVFLDLSSDTDNTSKSPADMVMLDSSQIKSTDFQVNTSADILSNQTLRNGNELIDSTTPANLGLDSRQNELDSSKAVVDNPDMSGFVFPMAATDTGEIPQDNTQIPKQSSEDFLDLSTAVQDESDNIHGPSESSRGLLNVSTAVLNESNNVQQQSQSSEGLFNLSTVVPDESDIVQRHLQSSGGLLDLSAAVPDESDNIQGQSRSLEGLLNFSASVPDGSDNIQAQSQSPEGLLNFSTAVLNVSDNIQGQSQSSEGLLNLSTTVPDKSDNVHEPSESPEGLLDFSTAVPDESDNIQGQSRSLEGLLNFSASVPDGSDNIQAQSQSPEGLLNFSTAVLNVSDNIQGQSQSSEGLLNLSTTVPDKSDNVHEPSESPEGLLDFSTAVPDESDNVQQQLQSPEGLLDFSRAVPDEPDNIQRQSQSTEGLLDFPSVDPDGSENVQRHSLSPEGILDFSTAVRNESDNAQGQLQSPEGLLDFSSAIPDESDNVQRPSQSSGGLLDLFASVPDDSDNIQAQSQSPEGLLNLSTAVSNVSDNIQGQSQSPEGLLNLYTAVPDKSDNVHEPSESPEGLLDFSSADLNDSDNIQGQTQSSEGLLDLYSAVPDALDNVQEPTQSTEGLLDFSSAVPNESDNVQGQLQSPEGLLDLSSAVTDESDNVQGQSQLAGGSAVQLDQSQSTQGLFGLGTNDFIGSETEQTIPEDHSAEKSQEDRNSDLLDTQNIDLSDINVEQTSDSSVLFDFSETGDHSEAIGQTDVQPPASTSDDSFGGLLDFTNPNQSADSSQMAVITKENEQSALLDIFDSSNLVSESPPSNPSESSSQLVDLI